MRRKGMGITRHEKIEKGWAHLQIQKNSGVFVLEQTRIGRMCGDVVTGSRRKMALILKDLSRLRRTGSLC